MRNRHCLLVLSLNLAATLPTIFSVVTCQAMVGQATEKIPAPTPVAATAATVVPTLVRYAGTALRGDGKAQTGDASTTFLIYKDEKGGEPLWVETQTVAFDSSGHYSVYLGAMNGSGLPAELFGTGEARWLEVQVAGEKQQARVLLTSVPYALKAADAATLGGLPASAFALAGSHAALAATGSASSSVTPDSSSTVSTTGGTSKYVPLFTGTSIIGNSEIYDTGTSVGIGDIPNASAKLDVNGEMIVRGNTTVSRIGNATSSKGYPSYGFDFYSNAYNSSSKATDNPHFQLQSEPTGNNTSSTGATFNLLYSNHGTTPAETGLSINPSGIISFANGQTFTSNATSGDAVLGTNASGTGVAGTSETGDGVTGYTTGAIGYAAGIYGEVGSASGTHGTAGVWGDSSTQVGVLGTSSSNTGVSGNTAGTTLNTAGVLGVAGPRTSFSGVAGVWGDAATHVGVYGSSNAYAGVAGQSTTGDGVDGVSTSNSGVKGTSTNGTGVAGTSTTANGMLGYTAGTVTNTAGVLGGAGGPSGYGGIAGVWGDSSANAGVLGTSQHQAGLLGISNDGSGVYGTSTNSVGVQGTSTRSNGVYGSSLDSIGVQGISSNTTGVYGIGALPSSEGQVFENVPIGVWGDSGLSEAYGVVGTIDTGTAGFFRSNSDYTTFDVFNDFAGGPTEVFEAGSESASCNIDTLGDLSCGGSINNIVKAQLDGGMRQVETYAVGSTENWFEDAGTVQLVRGKAHVNLETVFGKTVNTGVEYHVFLTPDGDCKGLYVSAKSANSFDVQELGGGTSSITFDYRIMAKRLGHENERLVDVTERVEKANARHPKLSDAAKKNGQAASTNSAATRHLTSPR